MLQLPVENNTLSPPAVQSPPAGQLRQPGSVDPDGPTRGFNEYVPGPHRVHAPGRPATLALDPVDGSRSSTQPAGQEVRLPAAMCTCITAVCIAVPVSKSVPTTSKKTGPCSMVLPVRTDVPANVGLTAMVKRACPCACVYVCCVLHIEVREHACISVRIQWLLKEYH